MKKLVYLSILLLISISAYSQSIVTKNFEDNGKALINPSMGWMPFYYSDLLDSYPTKDPSDTWDYFEGISTVYMRISWSFIQKTEDSIDWSIIDSVAQRFISKGKKIALRFVTSNMHHGTPEWVFKAGAKYYTFEKFNTKFKDPIFDDPIFLEKLEKFLSEAGKRYGNNPNVAFIDVGTFGLWGEGHTYDTQRLSMEETARLVMIHAKLHHKYFPNTLLCISDDVIGNTTQGKDFPLMKKLREELGITFRDDSILVDKQWYHEDLAQNYWQTMPVILEHQHLEVSLRWNVWSNAKLLDAVEKHHASYLSVHGWVPEEKKVLGEYLDKINRRLGYRIQLREISYPNIVSLDKKFYVKMKLANAGVAPCYVGGYPTLTFKDKKGAIALVLTSDKLNVKNLKVGPVDNIPTTEITVPLKINAYAPDIADGRYDVYFSIGDLMGTPTLNLPLDNDDGQKRYKIGKIRINSEFLGRYDGNAGQIWDKLTKDPCITHLTKTFNVDKPIKKAFGFIAIDDFGDLFVNGVHIKKTGSATNMKYVDFTKYLKQGENLIAVFARNMASHCGVIAEFKIEYSNGTTDTIITDSSWKASDKAIENWNQDSSVSNDWNQAIIVKKVTENTRMMK